jgi:DNA gyrase subunit A
LFFTNKGLMYKKRAYEIPSTSRTSKGTHVSNLLNLSENESVTNMISIKSIEEKGFLLFATQNGLIKRTPISAYDTQRQNSGIIAIKLRGDDQVAFVLATDGNKDIVLITRDGNCVRYAESVVTEHGRSAGGVSALKLSDDDKITQVLALDKGAKPNILVVTAAGYGKQTNAEEYRAMSGRNAKGYAVMKRSAVDSHGGVSGACAVADGDNVLIMTKLGKVIRISVDDIRSTGRATTGVRVVKLADADTVVRIARLKPEMVEAEL